MEITVERKWKRVGYTIGVLYVNGKRFGNGKRYCSTLEDTDRGLSSDMAVGDIFKAKVRGQTAIPKGRYEVRMTYSPRFKRPLPLLVDVPAYEGVRIHCLTPDMEILTENGWQNLESFESSPAKKCFSYNIEKQRIELVPIERFVKQEYDGDLYCCTGRRINYSVTDKHRMWVGNKTHDKNIEWNFRTADALTKSNSFLSSAMKDGETISQAQLDFYRLLMAVQADGYIYNRSNTSASVRFHFVKERKIKRVEELVTALHCTYTKFVDKEGKTHLTLEPKLSEQIVEVMNPCRYMFNYKELPLWLLQFDSNVLRELLETYLFFDGRWENYLRNHLNMVISSVNKRTLDLLQAMATLCGMRSYIHPAHGSECMEIVLYDNQSMVTPNPETYSIKHYTGVVWCMSNVNTTLIVRQNNRPMIIGNCGNTAADTEGCILVGENTERGKVLNSRYWMGLLLDKINEALARKERIYITIK